MVMTNGHLHPLVTREVKKDMSVWTNLPVLMVVTLIVREPVPHGMLQAEGVGGYVHPGDEILPTILVLQKLKSHF